MLKPLFLDRRAALSGLRYYVYKYSITSNSLRALEKLKKGIKKKRTHGLRRNMCWQPRHKPAKKHDLIRPDHDSARTFDWRRDEGMTHSHTTGAANTINVWLYVRSFRMHCSCLPLCQGLSASRHTPEQNSKIQCLL